MIQTKKIASKDKRRNKTPNTTLNVSGIGGISAISTQLIEKEQYKTFICMFLCRAIVILYAIYILSNMQTVATIKPNGEITITATPFQGENNKNYILKR